MGDFFLLFALCLISNPFRCFGFEGTSTSLYTKAKAEKQTFSSCEPGKNNYANLWTDTKNYVNRCEPAWKFMRTGVNRKHTPVSVTLKNMWTSVNQQKILREPMWTGMGNYVNRCEPWFALTESLQKRALNLRYFKFYCLLISYVFFKKKWIKHPYLEEMPEPDDFKTHER